MRSRRRWSGATATCLLWKGSVKADFRDFRRWAVLRCICCIWSRRWKNFWKGPYRRNSGRRLRIFILRYGTSWIWVSGWMKTMRSIQSWTGKGGFWSTCTASARRSISGCVWTGEWVRSFFQQLFCRWIIIRICWPGIWRTMQSMPVPPLTRGNACFWWERMWAAAIQGGARKSTEEWRSISAGPYRAIKEIIWCFFPPTGCWRRCMEDASDRRKCSVSARTPAWMRRNGNGFWSGSRKNARRAWQPSVSWEVFFQKGSTWQTTGWSARWWSGRDFLRYAGNGRS